MINPSQASFVATVKEVARLIAGIDYALIGSANLYLQGLDVEPRDIDILTTPEGIRQIDAILAPYRTREIWFDESDGRNSFRSFYEHGGVEIEVLGNVANAYRAEDALTRTTLVDADGAQVPALVLSEELAAYRAMGRDDKVRLLEDWLESY